MRRKVAQPLTLHRDGLRYVRRQSIKEGGAVTADEQRELAEMLAEMGYDRATRTWNQPIIEHRKWSVRVGKNIVMGAACIGAAWLITSALPGPPHLPIGLAPFFLGVALAAKLGCRKTGWYAFGLALPAFYMDASVACLPWIALAIATLAVIASIRSRRDRPGRDPRRQSTVPARSPSSPSFRLDGPPSAPFGSTTGA